MSPKFPVLQRKPAEATPLLYLADGSRYRRSHNSSICDHEEKEKIIMTGTFPVRQGESPLFVETIRDPENSGRLMFVKWENGKATVVPQIEREGKIFVPPDPTSSSFPLLSLPNGLLPCGEPAELLAEIASTTSKFVKLRDEQLRIFASFALASWFPDCFEAAPYLWIVGPLGSAKTKLLKLLWCFCRRGLIAGDLRSGSLYKLTDTWNPTLIIDELERGISGESAELLRMLRAGSVPGVPTFRNGQGYSVYGLKVIASRQPLDDTAVSSRGPTISMLPTEDDSLPLEEEAVEQIAKEYQAKLLMFRLKYFRAMKNFRMQPDSLRGMSPRMKQIARALTAPLLGDSKSTSELLAILGGYDDEIRIERALEPEWLVAEALYDLCHEGMERGRRVWLILVGGVAARVNQQLETRGEDCMLSAKKAGLVLKSLELRTKKLNRLGRGLEFTPVLMRKIHEIARQLGIDRRAIAPSSALESGYGGAPCTLCEEFGLTAGLRFEYPSHRLHPSQVRRQQLRPLFDHVPEDVGENSAPVNERGEEGP